MSIFESFEINSMKTNRLLKAQNWNVSFRFFGMSANVRVAVGSVAAAVMGSAIKTSQAELMATPTVSILDGGNYVWSACPALGP